MAPPVREQIKQRFDAVARKQAAAAPAELAAAFGDYAMVLHAAEYYEAAEPAYRNARVLAPDDVRWSYYLGHLSRSRGDLSGAIEAFRRVLEARPSDVAALVWLGRVYLGAGQPDQAEPYLARARSLAPRTAAAVAGLGQAALARRDYAQAAALLEEALSLAPGAASLHAPLAQAYRGLGDAAAADAHVGRWRDVEVGIVDPLLDALRLSLESPLAYEERGGRAADAGQFAEAARLFRAGLSLAAADAPISRSLRHRLGLALYMSGDLDGAMREFREAVRLAPAAGPDEPAARVHYSLGVIMASAGRDHEAIRHLSDAVRYDPNYEQAHAALADALRRGGAEEHSLPHYREAVRINPQASQARLGYALALTRLRRWVEARAWLEDSVRAQPDRQDLSIALARVLAAAPDSRARDGARALAIVEKLLATNKTTELGETLAMALAETGRFEQAVGVQLGVLDAAERAGQHAAARRLARVLRQYQERRPCRTPWADDDPVHRPGPSVSAELARRLS